MSIQKKTKSDPTGQAINRRIGAKRLRFRLNKSRAKIKALFRGIPRSIRREKVITNDTQNIYVYDVSAGKIEALERSISQILNDELLETNRNKAPDDWYWEDDIEKPYRQGAAEEVVTFNRMIAQAAILALLVGGLTTKVEIPKYLRSTAYSSGLEKAFALNFGAIKSLANTTSSQVSRAMLSGIQSGMRPADILASIDERFDVASTSAVRSANTLINEAYNNAKLDTTKNIGEQTGLEAGVVHISALLPNGRTRATHAARHGNAYSVADQLQWWDQGSNRINCHCTTRPVLIDKDGNAIDPSDNSRR